MKKEEILKECTTLSIEGKTVFIQTSELERFKKYKWNFRGRNKNTLTTTIRFKKPIRQLDITIARFLHNITPQVKINLYPRFPLSEHIYHKDAYIKQLKFTWADKPPYRRKYESSYIGVIVERTGTYTGRPTAVSACDGDGNVIHTELFKESFKYGRTRALWRSRQLKRELINAEYQAAHFYDAEMIKRHGHEAITNFYSSLKV